MTDMLWVVKLKKLTSKGDLTLKDVALKMEMSEQNLHKCIKRGSVETKYLHKLADSLGLTLSYFFDEDNTADPQVKIDGKKNQTVVGNNIRLNNSTQNENMALLEERIKNLEDKIIEKNKQLEEKERLIKVLMGKK